MAGNRRPILVTGSHRSGTTWVGRMIAASPGIGYIHEPFNLGTSRGVCDAPIDRWFTHVSEENEAEFLSGLQDTVAFRYSIGGATRGIRSWEDARGRWYEFRRFLRYRLSGLRPLVKDPIALLSAEWLASRFGMQVLVMIRHPAAFASSLKRLDWTYPFRHLLDQPVLMRDHLGEFEEEIRRFAAEEQDIVDQAALLWAVLYSVVAEYRSSHEDWLFLRHEDLAASPVDTFRRIFGFVDVPLTAGIEAKVRESSATGNAAGTPEDPHCIERDSRATIRKWHEELSAAEIDRVRERVEPVSRLYYADDDWA